VENSSTTWNWKKFRNLEIQISNYWSNFPSSLSFGFSNIQQLFHASIWVFTGCLCFHTEWTIPLDHSGLIQHSLSFLTEHMRKRRRVLYQPWVVERGPAVHSIPKKCLSLFAFSKYISDNGDITCPYLGDIGISLLSPHITFHHLWLFELAQRHWW